MDTMEMYENGNITKDEAAKKLIARAFSHIGYDGRANALFCSLLENALREIYEEEMNENSEMVD